MSDPHDHSAVLTVHLAGGGWEHCRGEGPMDDSDEYRRVPDRPAAGDPAGSETEAPTAAAVGELRGRIAELEAQNEALRRSSRAARETSARAIEFLRLVNECKSVEDLVRDATRFFHALSGCEAVAIRLALGDDYPYCESLGFPQTHLARENVLRAVDECGRPLLDDNGNVILECLCGDVIEGRFDPRKPFFTANGSFWTNSSTEWLASTTPADRPARVRGVCHQEGYESVALIPLRFGNERLGLLQLNDSRRGRFSPDIIARWESQAGHLAAALSKLAAATELRQSREDHDRAQAVGQVGSWRLDVRSDVLTWSAETYRIFGVPEGTRLTYERFLECVHPDDRDYVDTRWQAALRGEPYDIEHRIVVDGDVKWVREKAYLEQGLQDELLGGFGIIQDITSRKAAEAAIRDSEARYHTLFEHMAEEVHYWRLVRDADGRIVTWRLVDANPVTLRSWGAHSIADVRDKSADEIFGPGATERYMPVVKKITSEGTPHSFEDYIARLDKYFRFTSVPLGDYVLTTGADITHLKKAEEALRAESETERARLEAGLLEAQKMEAVGRLAAGISHDMNNLLMGIDGCADMALKRLEARHPARGYVEQIASAIASGAGATRQLLSFSRRRSHAPRVFDLGLLIRRREDLLRRMLGEDIELSVRIEQGASFIRGDEVQIDQGLMNLVLNARHAMPRGGRLHIEVRTAAVAKDDLAARAGLTVGPHVALIVKDTGCGMSEEVRAHAFEPFFTTRGTGEGTGLGLATVYAAVRQAQGHVSLESEEGKGTRFEILVPRAEPDDAPPPPTREAYHAAASRERVLVVEDDELVRMAVRQYLEGEGYRVLTAGDEIEALGLCQVCPDPIDLLVTDMVLPGRGGIEIAREVAELEPGVRVLYVSAHSQEWLEETGRIPPGVPVLQKPFSRDQLLARVRGILGHFQMRTSAAASPCGRPGCEHARAARPSSATPVPLTSRTSGTVLLVGECGAVMDPVRDRLMRDGWRVVEAESGNQAMRICREASRDIGLLLTDYTLSDMRGDTLAREVRAIAPAIAVAYMSGYPDLELDPPGPLLRKPVDLDKMTDTLRALAEKRPAGVDDPPPSDDGSQRS